MATPRKPARATRLPAQAKPKPKPTPTRKATKPRPAPTHPVKVPGPEARRILAKLRPICMALPGATERLSHGAPCWFAGAGRSFANFDDHHHGARRIAVWLPQPPGAQAQLIDSDPDRFFRPPYVGVAGWIGVQLDDDPDWGMVGALIELAFRHVAGKRLLAQLDAG